MQYVPRTLGLRADLPEARGDGLAGEDVAEQQPRVAAEETGGDGWGVHAWGAGGVNRG